jgi:hypothetical protein
VRARGSPSGVLATSNRKPPLRDNFIRYMVARCALFTRVKTLMEESALHWVARRSERCSEVVARGLMAIAPEAE